MHLHHLFTCNKVLFYTHTCVLAVIHVIITCTSIDSPQLDQVTHATTYQSFDYKQAIIVIASVYNQSID